MQTKDDAVRDLREELFRKQGRGWFRVATGSMRPIIEPGEKVLVEQIAPAAARRGDIVLYREGRDYVTHRLVGFLTRGGKDLFLVKGDAGSVPEELAPEAVCGRVTLVEKRGGGQLLLDSVRGRVVDGFLGWKNCRFSRPAAALDRWKERARPHPAFPLLRFAYRLLRFPAAALQRVFLRIFL